MFFAKRRWALRVTEEMELDVHDSAATEIVSMIISGSKQFSILTRSVGQKLSHSELILMSAASLHSNQSAKQRMLQYTQLSDEEIDELFMSALFAAKGLAEKYNLSDLTNSKCFDL